MDYQDFHTRLLARELREKLDKGDDHLRFNVPQFLIELFEQHRGCEDVPNDAMNATLWCLDWAVERGDATEGIAEGIVFLDETKNLYQLPRPIFVSTTMMRHLFDKLCEPFPVKETTYDDYRPEPITDAVWEKETKRWRAAVALRQIAVLPNQTKFIFGNDALASKHLMQMRTAFVSEISRLASVLHVRSVQRELLRMLSALAAKPWRMREEICVIAGYLANKGLSTDFLLREVMDDSK